LISTDFVGSSFTGAGNGAGASGLAIGAFAIGGSLGFSIFGGGGRGGFLTSGGTAIFFSGGGFSRLGTSTKSMGRKSRRALLLRMMTEPRRITKK
jgi:hypothetical protein